MVKKVKRVKGEDRQALNRSEINKRCRIIVSMFKWGVAEELVPEPVWSRLRSVRGLREGEEVDDVVVREGEPVMPVRRSDVRRVRRQLSRQVRAMVALQLLTGARPGELVNLTPIDLGDMTENVWLVRLRRHKTKHKGKVRTLPFGPRAQRVLRLFLRPGIDVTAPLFSPRDAFAERKRVGAAGSRREDQKPNPRKTGRVVGAAYTSASYGRAIADACKRAGVERWTPYQLRHTHAVAIRERFGLDAAQAVLGHSSARMSEHYAKLTERTLVHVMEAAG